MTGMTIPTGTGTGTGTGMRPNIPVRMITRLGTIMAMGILTE